MGNITAQHKYPAGEVAKVLGDSLIGDGSRFKEDFLYVHNRFEELTNPSARVQAEQGMASKTSAFFTFLQSYQLGGPGQLGFMTKGPVT
ncbi:hypothetical protein KAI87_10035, partial [Myxococcota bacterium]|nr:hypothetical protein [Myxococcota bacterium]